VTLDASRLVERYVEVAPDIRLVEHLRDRVERIATDGSILHVHDVAHATRSAHRISVPEARRMLEGR